MKKYLVSFILLIPLSLSCIPSHAAEDGEYCGGVFFKSHQVNKENRTYAYLENNDELKMNDYFGLSFDFKLYDAGRKFGQICCLSLDEQTTVKLMSSIREGRIYVSMLFNGYEVKVWEYLPDYSVWHKISFVFENDKRQLSVVKDNDSLQVDMKHRHRRVHLFFGANGKNTPMDVSPFILGAVKIYSSPQTLSHHWPMTTHSQNCVTDIVRGRNLMVVNARWLIDSHMRWSLCDSMVLPRAHVVFGAEDHLWLVSADTVYKYDLQRLCCTKFATTAQNNLHNLANLFYWNETTGRLEYLYCQQDKVYDSHFDESESLWQPAISYSPEMQTHNNTFCFGGRVCQFFGYGCMRYSSKMNIVRNHTLLPFDSGMHGAKIMPRYLSAVGRHDDCLYIFSGIGSDSTGNQLHGSRIFNDFYRIDARTGRIDSLAKIPELANELAAHDLVTVDGGESFLGLFFNPFIDASYLLLKRIWLRTGAVKNYGDTLAYKFYDMDSEARLHLSENRKQLYAVTRSGVDEERSRIKIYRLQLPLFDESDIFVAASAKHSVMRYLCVVLLLAVLGGMGCMLLRRRRKKLPVVETAPAAVEGEVAEVETVETSVEDTVSTMVFAEPKMRPGIYLLGGFRVVSRSSEDITGRFTPIMRQLLSLIILYTLKDGRGVSNDHLKDFLWMDKSDERAINNRSVNIRKIRLLLAEVGGFKLSTHNSYWKFIPQEEDYCDIFEAAGVLNLYGVQGSEQEIPSCDMLLSVAAYGVLLPNLNFEFFDDFKADYASAMLDVVNNELVHADSPDRRIALADVIFHFSLLDEEAVRVKCAAYKDMGKNGLAKSTYEKFVRDYEQCFGEPFPKSFADIISSED